VTIFRTLLTRGYFPKELPPAFFTEQFASFATTRAGRAALSAYGPLDSYTECVRYQLALAGGDRRELKIPHPASFASLAGLTAKHFGRLLLKASRSPFSKSRPVYSTSRHRAVYPMMKPSNLAREKAAGRGGASFLLKADISHFYPSLYTHAVGWAIDPKLRIKAHWRNTKLLGKKIDQALMDLDGKISQGIPIGNDISFLLTEIVLAHIDRRLAVPSERSFRWFDDYEIAFDTRVEADACLKALNVKLAEFRLRLNPKKTQVIRLPCPVQDEWQQVLAEALRRGLRQARDVVAYFDTAFRLRERFPDSPVLMYCLGMLFSLKRPATDVGRVVQSCVTQAVVCEPGAAQKAFALLTLWHLNGFQFDASLIKNTINQVVLRHQAGGLSSDVAWALAFCLEQGMELDSKAAQILSTFDDDAIAIQSLDMYNRGLLPRGFTAKRIGKVLRSAHMDREHWLLAYEAVRHGFSMESETAVRGNPLFAELLARRITFYKPKLPPYALVVHPGGAPEWVVQKWMKALLIHKDAEERERILRSGGPVVELIERDLLALTKPVATQDDAIADLLAVFEPEALVAEIEEPAIPYR
jgi:hypothetical protein